MPEVRSPMFISSRLMAALTVDGAGTLHLHAQERDEEDRVVYHYIVEDTEHRIIHEGHDLRSGVGFPVDYRDMMASLLGFLGAYAEEYRSTMEGDEFYEWCYLHDTELVTARFDLEEVTDE